MINQKKITDREREILNLISLGLSTSKIASTLYVSSETIKSHRKNILTKLGAKNTANLIRLAYELKIFKCKTHSPKQTKKSIVNPFWTNTRLKTA